MDCLINFMENIKKIEIIESNAVNVVLMSRNKLHMPTNMQMIFVNVIVL